MRTSRVAGSIDRWRNALRREDAPRRATYRAIDDVPCVTAAIRLFAPNARPEVVAVRRRNVWRDHAREVCTHELIGALRASGAHEVLLRWRARSVRLELAVPEG